jgi:hypothetical protein
MRVWLISMVLSVSGLGQGSDATKETWKVNLTRSTFAGKAPFKSLVVRIESHPKGEVFTEERIETDGRTTSYSTLLYFDGEPRPFENFGCSGTQLSWRLDHWTVEVFRTCGSGGWNRLLRHISAKADELVLDIAEQLADGRRINQRFTFDKQ